VASASGPRSRLARPQAPQRMRRPLCALHASGPPRNCGRRHGRPSRGRRSHGRFRSRRPSLLPGRSALLGRDPADLRRELFVRCRVDGAVADGRARRILAQLVVALPVARRPHRARHESAAAVAADVAQDAVDAAGTEGAFVGADPRVQRVGQEGSVAVFAGRSQFEQGVPPGSGKERPQSTSTRAIVLPAALGNATDLDAGGLCQHLPLSCFGTALSWPTLRLSCPKRAPQSPRRGASCRVPCPCRRRTLAARGTCSACSTTRAGPRGRRRS
jgi:hypothetical protein